MAEQSRYEGMTMNERLFDAGIMQAFGDAVLARDRAEMIRLLASVDLDEPAWSTDMILQEPERYGF